VGAKKPPPDPATSHHTKRGVSKAGNRALASLGHPAPHPERKIRENRDAGQ